MNGDIVPVKSLYFEAGSKSLEQGGKYSGLYGKLSIIKWPNFIPFRQYSPKLPTHVYAIVLSHSVWSKYRNSKNKIFMTSLLLNSTIVLWERGREPMDDGYWPERMSVLLRNMFTTGLLKLNNDLEKLNILRLILLYSCRLY